MVMEVMGGGIFAKTALSNHKPSNFKGAVQRPRPYSRHCGEAMVGYAALTIIYAHMGINGNGVEVDNDAARRVATSFEKWENRI